MKLRNLGRSGLLVSEVGLGCNVFGSRIDQAGADAVIDAAFEAGINFFDTADYYGRQQSEILLGKALGKRRHDAVLATKFGMPLSEDPTHKGASRRWIMRAVEASLKRLGTDYIDLYQLHFPDPATPVEETLRALDDLVTQGKVRYIGASNHAAWQIVEAEWIARHEGRTGFVSVQNKLSLLEQAALAEELPVCERYGLGFLPYFPLASGLLTGKYRKGEAPGADTRFGAFGTNFGDGMDDAKLARVERLQAWAETRGHTLLELAFGWLLAVGSASVIAGATKPEQVRGNAAAAAWTLTPEEVAEATAMAKA